MTKPRWRRADSETHRLDGSNDECVVLQQNSGWLVCVDTINVMPSMSCRARRLEPSLKAAKQRAERIWAAMTEASDGSK